MSEVDVYHRLISRWDVSASQATKPGKDGKYGYFKKSSELTNKLLLQSLKSDVLTIGTYCINPDDQTVVNPIIDIDGHTEDERAAVVPLTKQVYGVLTTAGLHPYIEASSGTIEDGAHVGLILEPTKAKDVRVYLLELLKDIQDIEIFPKQDYVQEGGYGNLVKLPWQYNNRTGQRSEIVDPKTLEPMPREQAVEYMLDLPVSVIPAQPDTVAGPDPVDVGTIPTLSKCGACFQSAYSNGTVLEGDKGHSFRLYACRELISHGATDSEIHEFFKRQDDYNQGITQAKIDDLRSQNLKPVTCKKITETGFVDAGVCQGCIRRPGKDLTTHDAENVISEDEYNKGAEAIIDNKFVLDVPDSHFIAKYVAWAKTTTDAFQEYHIVSALWLLSSLCKGKPYVPLASDKVYLNLWLQIHGASTISRKSVAVNKAKKIYEAVTGEIMLNPDFSRDGLLRELSETPVQATIRDESSSLLSKMHQKYNDGIFPMECQLHDRQSINKTLAKAEDSIVIIDPYITRLYAGTPETYTKIMCIEDFECGWGYRWLHIHPTYKRERRPLRMESENDVTLWAAVLEQTKKQHIRFNNKAEFPMGFSPAALKMFQDITMKLENYAVDKNNSYFNGMIGRGNDQILKIAALYELGKEVQSFEIQIDSIVFATRFVIYCLDCELKIISNLLENIEINKVEKVLHAIKKSNGTITHSKLLQNVRMYKEDITKCIDVLIEGEMLEAHEVRAKNGKIARHYRLLVNEGDEINFKQIFGPGSFIDDIDVMHDIQLDKRDKLDRLDTLDELDANKDTQKNESNLSNLKNPNVRQYDDVDNIVSNPSKVSHLSNPTNLEAGGEVSQPLKASQYDHAQTAMDLIDSWYDKRPDNPAESRSYLVPELVRQTGISQEAAHKHVIGAFKVKGWA